MTAPGIDFSIPTALRGEIRLWRKRAAIGGIAGAALLLLGALISPDQFYRSYLWSYTLVVGLGAGSMAWLMLQYLSGGAWGVVIRRPCEAAARTLPLLAVLFLPIAIGIPRLYEWSHADFMNAEEVLRHKQAYLNVPFFLVRTALYFAGWIFCSWRLSALSAAQDREGPGVHDRLVKVAAPGILFWAGAVTFMAIDWVLSLDPHWFSTIFGLLFMAGQGLSSMAFLITLLVLLSSRAPLAGLITPRHLHDLGKLLLANVMVWAYFSFSQFLIIWSANLPSEIPWYINRLNGGWQYVALLLVLCHFALPFALLLSRDLKRNYKLLAGIALFILFMRMVDLYWVVAPDLRKGAFGVSWLDFAAPLGLGGLWLAWFLTQLEKQPLLPIHDPHLEEALEHGRE